MDSAVRFLVWVGLLQLGLVTGCNRPEAAVQHLAQVSAPHERAFTRFEQWVLRAHDGSPELDGPSALEETLFAPIRHDQAVLAAMVTHDQRGARRWVFPREAAFPEHASWTRVRHGTGLPVQVAEHTECPLGLPSWWRQGVPRACVMLARTVARGAGESVTVTVAFTRGP